MNQNNEAKITTPTLGGSHGYNNMFGGASINPDNFTFQKGENGGTVMGPFKSTETETDGPNIDKYMIIIVGNVDKNGENVTFKPESNSIVLFKNENTDNVPFASIKTGQEWTVTDD